MTEPKVIPIKPISKPNRAARRHPVTAKVTPVLDAAECEVLSEILAQIPAASGMMLAACKRAGVQGYLKLKITGAEMVPDPQAEARAVAAQRAQG